MIDEDRTMQLFGYESTDLAPRSNKKIVAVCDECGLYRLLTKAAYKEVCRVCTMRSPEVRKRMSIAKSNPSSETRKKMSDAKIGKPLSEEHKQTLSAAQLRRPYRTYPMSVHIAASCRQRGIDVADFDGFLYDKKQYYNSPRYAEWREAVFERDDFTCFDCGQIGCRLNAHHILPVKDHPEHVFNPMNGITLCLDCHKAIKNKEYERVADYLGAFFDAKGIEIFGGI